MGHLEWLSSSLVNPGFGIQRLFKWSSVRSKLVAWYAVKLFLLCIVQGFGGNADNPHLPHNHERNQVVYTGTHDNDTV